MTIFLGISAVNTGNNLVYIIVSAMLSFMGISGFFGKKNLQGIDLEVDFPEEIFAGSEFPVKIKITNKKRFVPSFLVRFHFEDKSFIVPFIDCKDSYTFYIKHTYNKRGEIFIKGFEICSVFPFNFFERCVFYKKKIPVIVYPYPKRSVFYSSSGKNKIEKSLSDTSRSGSFEDIISIRDYSRGDPVKLIHWKASAKTDKLKTKELSDSSGEPVVIDIDKIPGSLEDRISAAAFFVIELYKKGVPFGLKTKGVFIKPECSRRQKALILSHLARM